MLLRLVWLVDGAGVACSVPETEVGYSSVDGVVDQILYLHRKVMYL